MQHSKVITNKVWQKQDCKHQIFQHLQPLRLQQQPTQQVQQMPHLNWSHFKPEFSGKPEEEKLIYLELMLG